jgi:predicted nucleic-acid-binding protein
MMPITASFAQRQDSLTLIRKNILKFNLTANSFLDNAILFEYERVLKNNQTISIQAGYNEAPFASLLDSARLETDLKKSGWSATVDYRFYLKKENKYAAPRGIYLAPFMSYHHFINERSLEVQSETGTYEPVVLDSKTNLFSVGGEIGYQFIIKNRWSIDLILLGPSITNYNLKMNLTGNLPEQELNDDLQEILSGMLDNYPFIGDLLDDNTAQANGRVNTWDLGFRYSIHVGFCF